MPVIRPSNGSSSPPNKNECVGVCAQSPCSTTRDFSAKPPGTARKATTPAMRMTYQSQYVRMERVIECCMISTKVRDVRRQNGYYPKCTVCLVTRPIDDIRAHVALICSEGCTPHVACSSPK